MDSLKYSWASEAFYVSLPERFFNEIACFESSSPGRIS